MSEMKFKHKQDIITVTKLKNEMLICETTNEDYNSKNSDGYWIATIEDINESVERGEYVKL
jgi:hypothetical protein